MAHLDDHIGIEIKNLFPIIQGEEENFFLILITIQIQFITIPLIDVAHIYFFTSEITRKFIYYCTSTHSCLVSCFAYTLLCVMLKKE